MTEKYSVIRESPRPFRSLRGALPRYWFVTEHLWGMKLIPKLVDDNFDDTPTDIERYVTVPNH